MLIDAWCLIMMRYKIDTWNFGGDCYAREPYRGSSAQWLNAPSGGRIRQNTRWLIIVGRRWDILVLDDYDKEIGEYLNFVDDDRRKIYGDKFGRGQAGSSANVP